MSPGGKYAEVIDSVREELNRSDVPTAEIDGDCIVCPALAIKKVKP